MVELKDSTPAKEAEAIRAARKPAERLVLLSEEGRQLSSVGLAELLGGWASERLALVIGGADGHDPTLKQQADVLLSLSALTFPHELARLMLVEQLYRASTILQGGPYHRS
jgi:23S rRNA (pseudouridine1915-N3)-methyltransferase